jgi:3-deoxy-7-phosphoheptulonate synthase
MSFEFLRELPTPEQIKADFPVSEKLKGIKAQRDKEIADVFEGKSDKFLAIIGPCSADNEDSVLDYVSRLAKVQEKIKDKVIIIPRIYTNKPRTTGEGYKGMLHQPDPEKESDMLGGLLAIRKMHLRAMEETELTAADEMLYPDNYLYLSDILSYVAVGARSVEDQQHRLTASGMDIPCGMKNPTSGTLSVMINSIIAAQLDHTFLYRGWEAKTTGNPLTHAILRGAANKNGQSIPNYHYEDIMLLNALYAKQNLANPAVIIDANHSNSNKLYKEQIRITKDVLHSRNYSPEAKKLVKGMMIESYIEEGTQKIGSDNHVYGKSITDPCIGWTDTEKLLMEIAELA